MPKSFLTPFLKRRNDIPIFVLCSSPSIPPKTKPLSLQYHPSSAFLRSIGYVLERPRIHDGIDPCGELDQGNIIHSRRFDFDDDLRRDRVLGKGGGKATVAQGQGTRIERVADAIQTAIHYGQQHLRA